MALNIALIGYGKMGREIEAVAEQRGHRISARVGREGMEAHDWTGVNVAIEFTQPDAAFGNVQALLAKGIPTVCGTTGWFARVPELDCSQTPLVYASNFSLGVNIAFQVNRYLAELMAPHSDYRAEIEEIHHTAKKDAPSGTAITLAEGILAANPGLNGWGAGFFAFPRHPLCDDDDDDALPPPPLSTPPLAAFPRAASSSSSSNFSNANAASSKFSYVSASRILCIASCRARRLSRRRFPSSVPFSIANAHARYVKTHATSASTNRSARRLRDDPGLSPANHPRGVPRRRQRR